MGTLQRITWLVLSVMLWAAPASALDVLVVQPEPSDAMLFEAFGRLRAELELQGFHVQVVESKGATIDSDALELEAQKRGTFAAISLERKNDGTTAEVRIVDRVTGKTSTRKLAISRAKDGPMLLAIRASDLLRASLIEFEPGQEPPVDVVGASGPPPRAVERFSRELPSFQVGLGALLLWHPELGVSFGGSVALNYRVHPRVPVGVHVGGPAFGGQYRSGENSASVRVEMAQARVAYNFGSVQPGARWEWGPVLEAGIVHTSARGNVASPLVSQVSDLWSFGLGGGGFLERAFNNTLSLGLELKCLGLIPQPVVAIDSERSAPLRVQGVSTLRLGVSF